MKVTFPAMQGQIGQKTYYSSLMKLNAIPKMFTFRDWAEFTAEEREQRMLNTKRVPDIKRYILDNEEGYLFASITASYKCEVKFIPANGNNNMGQLEMEFEDANFVINDGQHRCAGIAQALRQNPALGEHTISVLLFPYESRERVQQMFSDLNRYVEKTSKSLDILYDRRDPRSIATMFALNKVPVFKELTEKASISLKSKDTKLFTLAALYDANAELLKGQVEDAEENATRLVEFWTAVAEHMPDWTAVLTGHKTSTELRAGKISAHSTVLRALGGIGAELMKESNWKERLAGLEQIDWSKNNPDWVNVCIIANSVVSNRQARAATKNYIKSKLGMELTEGEQRSIAKAA